MVVFSFYTAFLKNVFVPDGRSPRDDIKFMNMERASLRIFVGSHCKTSCLLSHKVGCLETKTPHKGRKIVETYAQLCAVAILQCCIYSVSAEEVLAQLNDQLNKRKAQLQDAGDKLTQIQQAINDQVQSAFLRYPKFGFSERALHSYYFISEQS